MAELGAFAKEIQALALHGVEQTEAYHLLTTQGKVTADATEGVELLGALIANQGRMIMRIAQEIDELRSRLNAANF